MKLPGFTAEASLFSLQQKTATHSSTERQRDVVIPQARVIEGFCIRNGSYCCFKDANGKWTCGRTLQA